MNKDKKRSKVWILLSILVIVCIGIGVYALGGKKNVTTKEFEEKMHKLTNGKVTLENPTVVGEGDEAIYFANWNGFKLSAKVKDDIVKTPIDVASPSVDKMNAQTTEDFKLLATNIVRNANTTLSKKESEQLLDDKLHFKEKMKDDQKYTYTQDGLTYKLYGGKTEDDWFWFTIEKAKDK